jgi:hypothetical protein
MHLRTAALILSLSLLAPSISFGRGGARSSGIHSGGFGRGSGSAVNGSGNSQVHDYDRSAPSAASGKSHSKKSSRATSNAEGSGVGQAFAPVPTLGTRRMLTSGVSSTRPATTNNSNTAATRSTTPTTNGNQTTQTPTIQFVSGFPFYWGLPWSSVLDPETAARRQYGPLVSNARYLIQAGIYPSAVALLQRVIAGAPGTRIAGQAQRLLASIPPF